MPMMIEEKKPKEKPLSPEALNYLEDTSRSHGEAVLNTMGLFQPQPKEKKPGTAKILKHAVVSAGHSIGHAADSAGHGIRKGMQYAKNLFRSDKKKDEPEEVQRWDQLTDAEQKKLDKHAGSDFRRILGKVKGWQLTAEQRKTPTAEEASSLMEKAEKGNSAIKDGAVGPLSDILSAAGSKAKDVIGSIKSAMEMVDHFFKLVKTLKSDYKKYLSSSSKEKQTRREQKQELTDDLEEIGSLISSIGEKLGEIPSAGPLGKIFKLAGIITGGLMKFYRDVKTVFKTRKSIKRMRKQKEIAKLDIYENQGKIGIDHVTREKGGSLHFNPEELALTDEIELTRRFSSADPSQKNLYLRSMEDYAITKELTGANQKRRNESMFNIAIEELGPVLSTSLLFAGPGGVIAGGVMDAVFSSLKAVKIVKHYGTKLGYKLKAPFLDPLKSPIEKLRKRHTLAVYMYDRLRDLAPHEAAIGAIPKTTRDPRQVAAVRDYLPERRIQKDRITAMGVDQEKMAAAPDAPAMLEIMRKGFYREVD